MLLIWLWALTACTGVPKENRQEAAAEQDARTFFESHPEYRDSEEKETLLYAIFTETMKKKENKNKTMLELLEMSDETYRVLVDFDYE